MSDSGSNALGPVLHIKDVKKKKKKSSYEEERGSVKSSVGRV